ncbi:MAG: ribonucleotide-diphosphate reductase subunit beta, partial [Deltaproteobacteria bacterium]|nr:ribonucleotide-diphosphate reductase subunit beta [Deltaproteobacteria bacterium]
MILDPGFNLTLRPMKYPHLYEMYRNAIKNTWTVEEVDFSDDLVDLREKLSEPEKFLIHRLVAFFATGDSIVSNNLVLNLYKHINSPEGRLYLSRQLFEEAVHVQFYLTLLDTYVPDPDERKEAFAAVHNIPSIAKKAEFSLQWTEHAMHLERIETKDQRRQFIRNMVSFAACNEGLFFFAAFAYVYFLRSKGLLHGLAAGTNWVFRDETCHINFAMEVIEIARKEDPNIFTPQMNDLVAAMIEDAVDCE